MGGVQEESWEHREQVRSLPGTAGSPHPLNCVLCEGRGSVPAASPALAGTSLAFVRYLLNERKEKQTSLGLGSQSSGRKSTAGHGSFSLSGRQPRTRGPVASGVSAQPCPGPSPALPAHQPWRTPLKTGTPSVTRGGGGSPRHLTVISTLSVDCHPPTPALQAPHTSPFTLNVTHSVAQHGQPVALCFHICLLPFQHKITTMIAKVPLCPSPRLFHQRLSPERWGPVLCVQPCPPGDWHGGRDSYSRRSHLRFADDTVAHRRSMTCPGPSGRKREE